jgi:PAS domain S-box-containing protein
MEVGGVEQDSLHNERMDTNMDHTVRAKDQAPSEPPAGRETAEPERVEFWEVSEQLLIAGLREHDLAGHLGRQLAFSRAITCSLAEGIFAVDGACQVTFINPAAELLLGWQGADLLGKNLEADALVQGNADTNLSEAALPVLEVLSGGATYRDIQAVFRRKDGTVFPVTYSIAPIVTGGQVVGAVVTFRDITERQRLQRLRNEYLQLISHDLRGPLAVISGHAQILQPRLAGLDLTREAQQVKVIVDSSARINRLIQDLLDRSLIEAGPDELHLVLVDLAQVLKRSVDQHIPPAERPRVEVDAGAPLLVVADPSQTERVIGNLLTNALKYSPPDTPVIVRGDQRDDEMVISVIDQGEGIAPDELSRLFQRFTRGRAGPKADVGGLGLGLYIARLIVEAHGGRMWAESALGNGSTFSFSLPTQP